MAVPAVPYETLASLVLKGARSAHVARKWSQDLGKLTYEAVCRALCPEAGRTDSVEHAAAVVCQSLSSIDIPGRARGGGPVKRGAGWAKDRFDRRREIPPIAALGLSFSQYLEQWMEAALEEQGARDAVNGVTCERGQNVPADSLPEAFPQAFRLELCRSPNRPARNQLIAELLEMDNLRSEIAAEERRALVTLRAIADNGAATTIGGAGIATGATVAAEFMEGLSDATMVGSGLGVLATGAAVGGVIYLARSRPKMRVALDEMIGHWLAEFLSRLTGHRVQAVPQAIGSAVTETLQLESRESAPMLHDPSSAALPETPPHDLIEDLSQRLIPHATTADDDDLVSHLWRLEDVLRRWERRPGRPARAAIYSPLLDLLEVADLSEQQTHTEPPLDIS